MAASRYNRKGQVETVVDRNCDCQDFVLHALSVQLEVKFYGILEPYLGMCRFKKNQKIRSLACSCIFKYYFFANDV